MLGLFLTGSLYKDNAADVAYLLHELEPLLFQYGMLFFQSHLKLLCIASQDVGRWHRKAKVFSGKQEAQAPRDC